MSRSPRLSSRTKEGYKLDASAQTEETGPTTPFRGGLAVPTLHVALQEGFTQDRVLVKVDGAEVANRPEVTTRNQIGFAEAVEVEVPMGETTVEVDVPGRQLIGTVQVAVEGKTYIGVSIEKGRLELRSQREAFGYL
jgi:RNase P/RNase MRP subunit p29